MKSEKGFAEEEIIKGLECCRSEDGNDCYSCPYYGKRFVVGSGGCSNQLVNDALELIKRLMEDKEL